jgi:hypothetical protein
VAKGQGNLNVGFAWDQGPKTVSEEQAWLESQNSYIKSTWSDIKTLAQELLDGKHSDPTRGALYFFSPIHMQKGYGPYEIPEIDKTALIPAWALPEGYNKTSPPPSDWKMVDFYITIPYSASGKLEWIGGLNNVRNYYFMFYRPSRTMISALLPKTCAVGQFRTEYYNNRSLSGSPVFTQCESGINYNWDWIGPGSGVGNDNFSVRWSGHFNFDAGNYIFRAVADDGIKVWVDDDLIINEWKDQPAQEYKQARSISAGEHEVKVEYYENSDRALVEVSWWRVLKQPDGTYYWTKPPIMERGNLAIPKEIFPDGKGVPIEIYVPPITGGSNALREDGGWKTIKQIEVRDSNFDWAKFIASYSPSGADTPSGSAITGMAGVIESIGYAISLCTLNISIEKGHSETLRMIIEMGDPGSTYFLRKYAGQPPTLIPNVQDIVIPKGNGTVSTLHDEFSNWIANKLQLEPDTSPNWNYAVIISIDKSHKSDECIAYLSLSQNGRIVKTPKLYSEDKLIIVRLKTPFSMSYETIVELAGEGLSNILECPLDNTESKIILKMLTVGYNRQAAVDYARRFAKTPNTSYRLFEKDCTNFASQVLREGGWVPIGNRWDWNSTRAWFYNDGIHLPFYQGYSRSWAIADDLAKFIETSGRGEKVTLSPKNRTAYMQLQIGDLVQYADSSGRMVHSMIVTKKDDSDIYVSYHTSETLDQRLSEIIEAHPDYAFYGWLIK